MLASDGAGRAQRAAFLTSENYEVSYSLLSTAVETTDLRRDLHLAQRKLGAAAPPGPRTAAGWR